MFLFKSEQCNCACQISDHTKKEFEKDNSRIGVDRRYWYCDKRNMSFPYDTKICCCHFPSITSKGQQQAGGQCMCKYSYYDQPINRKPAEEQIQGLKPPPKQKSKLMRLKKSDNFENDYIVKTEVKIRKCKCKCK